MIAIVHTDGTLYLVFSDAEQAAGKVDETYDMLIAGGHVSTRICCCDGYDNAIEVGKVSSLANETIFCKLP